MLLYENLSQLKPYWSIKLLEKFLKTKPTDNVEHVQVEE